MAVSDFDECLGWQHQVLLLVFAVQVSTVLILLHLAIKELA